MRKLLVYHLHVQLNFKNHFTRNTSYLHPSRSSDTLYLLRRVWESHFRPRPPLKKPSGFLRRSTPIFQHRGCNFDSLTLPQNKTALPAILFCGGCGIRTHESLRTPPFQDGALDRYANPPIPIQYTVKKQSARL
jgi:hypothetical protein